MEGHLRLPDFEKYPYLLRVHHRKWPSAPLLTQREKKRIEAKFKRRELQERRIWSKELKEMEYY